MQGFQGISVPFGYGLPLHSVGILRLITCKPKSVPFSDSGFVIQLPEGATPIHTFVKNPPAFSGSFSPPCKKCVSLWGMGDRLTHILLIITLLLAGCTHARQALQHSMDLDKACVDVVNDSLARVAYDHYSRWGSRRSKMLSAYYLARVEENAGNNVEAAVHFMEAERRAHQIRDYHYCGFAQQHLAELHARNYDHEEAQVYNLKAIESFTLSGDTLAADYSRLDAARQYFIRKELDKAEMLVDSLLQNGNRNIAAYATAIKGDICFAREEWELASDFYQSFEANGYPPVIRILGNSAIIQERMGFPHRADSLMDLALGQIASAVDSTIYFSCANDIFLLRDDYPNAYKALKATSSYQNDAVSFLLARSTTHAQKAYFEERYHLELARERSLALIAALVILSLGVVIFFIIRALRRKKEELEREREMIQALREDLLLLQKEQKASGVMLDTLIMDRINKIQQLSASYFYWTDEGQSLQKNKNVSEQTKEVIREFRYQLKELRDDPNFFSTLESALNLAHGKLMQRLRNAVVQEPAIHFEELDFHLLSLLFFHFSSKGISFIMDMKDDTVRKRKSRYRKLFAEQGEAFSEFLEQLS